MAVPLPGVPTRPYYADPDGIPPTVVSVRVDTGITLAPGTPVVTPADFAWPDGATVEWLPYGRWVAYFGTWARPEGCRYSSPSLTAVHEMITAVPRGTHG